MTAKKRTLPNSGAIPPLAQHRRRNGVTLEDIAESTKISLRFLQAIEAEEFETLPGGIFARSYLRQYAAAIGFDEDELLRRYRDCVGTEDPTPLVASPKPANSAESPRKRSGLRWIKGLGAIRF